MNDNLSKQINKKILIASLVYLLIFLVSTFFYTIYKLGIIFFLKNMVSIITIAITLSPVYYLISCSQILIIGFLLKFFYRNKYLLLNKYLSLKNKSFNITLLLFTFFWVLVNFYIWSQIKFRGFH